MWANVLEISTPNLKDSSYWTAIRVWLERPHILNRRVIGVKPVETVSLKLSTSIPDTLTLLGVMRSETLTSDNITLSQLLINKGITCKPCPEITTQPSPDIEVALRLLLPKSPDKFYVVPELNVLDRQSKEVIISSVYKETSGVHHLSPTFTYRISALENSIRLDVLSLTELVDLTSPAVSWLSQTVLPKIVKWATEENVGKTLPSLTLVPIDRYSALRHQLKSKYGSYFVKIWPESTDPYKFVYEDIAIAAYLLALWEEERERKHLTEKQSFVDLGCGNGLLVHILSSEGHPGIGLDIRSRNIWKLFGNNTKLIESTITPSDKMLFPEYDWLIGNHSDELTPWIPLIATRSSFHMRVFLLPCCAFTFDGKYQRTHPGSSRYQSYLNFVEELCNKMGFYVHRDKLRIPSTKRVCFVCMERNYDKRDEPAIDIARTSYVQKFSRCPSADPTPSDTKQRDEETPKDDQKWASDFQPRAKIEPVRNCTQLDRDFLDDTLKTLVSLLLESGDEFLDVNTTDGIRRWKVGGSTTIENLAKQLHPNTKKQLKQQCGGLQTLLRNHRNIFKIENGLVSISMPQLFSEGNKQPEKRGRDKLLGRRNCWHFVNHPDGCPLGDDICNYVHNRAE